MQKKICKRPFEWLEISGQKNNETYLCCPGWLPYSIGNAKTESINALWRSEKATRLRKSVIDGSFKYCNSSLCPHLNEMNSSSDENNPVSYVDDATYRQYVRAVYAPETFLSPPKTLNCAYDRSCNLMCPSCRTKTIQSDKETRAAHQQLISRVLSEIGSDLETLYVTGSGDPFGSRHFFELLTSDYSSRFPKLSYRIHTNALLLDKNRWEKLAPIHDRIAEIEISIDGASASSYEVNRYPGKWDDLLNSMKFISSALLEKQNIRLKFNYVVQENNWREMKTFFRLADSWGANIVKFSKLNNWGTFSEAEFKLRSVHLPDHPNFSEFLDYINNPFWLNKKIVSDFDAKIMASQLREAKIEKIDVMLL
jgi:sulfatase maturation enzyme AslB (radical SAM superfamily)